MYDRTAPIYDFVYAGIGKDYVAEASRLRDLILERQPEAETLLDVACGTGLHLAEFRRWYTVEGVDVSVEMLDVARRRLPDVPLHHGDMRTFAIGRRFDVVTCLFSSIGYMATVVDLHRAVANMAGHVRPGGVLMIEAWFEPDAWERGRVAHDVIESGGMTVVRVARSDRRDRVALVEYHHLVAGPEAIDHIVEHHELSLFTGAEYEGAFEAAGIPVERIDDVGTGRGVYVGVMPD